MRPLSDTKPHHILEEAIINRENARRKQAVRNVGRLLKEQADAVSRRASIVKGLAVCEKDISRIAEILSSIEEGSWNSLEDNEDKPTKEPH